MAYAQRVPILTLVQPGIKRQGMLSTRIEWVAIETDLTPAVLFGEEFRQCFDEWLNLVLDGKKAKKPQEPVDIQQLSIGSILSSLRPGQLYALLTAIAIIVSAVGTGAFKAGQWTGRDEPRTIAAPPPDR